MQLFAQTVKFAEAHDQRPPLVRINVMALVCVQQRFINVYAHDPGFNRQRVIPLDRIS